MPENEEEAKVGSNIYLINRILFSTHCIFVVVVVGRGGWGEWGAVFNVVFVKAFQGKEVGDLQFKFKYCGDNDEACLEIRHYTGEKVL